MRIYLTWRQVEYIFNFMEYVNFESTSWGRDYFYEGSEVDKWYLDDKNFKSKIVMDMNDEDVYDFADSMKHEINGISEELHRDALRGNLDGNDWDKERFNNLCHASSILRELR